MRNFLGGIALTVLLFLPTVVRADVEYTGLTFAGQPVVLETVDGYNNFFVGLSFELEINGETRQYTETVGLWDEETGLVIYGRLLPGGFLADKYLGHADTWEGAARMVWQHLNNRPTKPEKI